MHTSREPTRSPHLRRSTVARALILPTIVGLTLTSCSSGYADLKGAELAGTDGQVNQIEIADLRLTTFAEGEPAQFLGVLANQSSAPLEMTFTDDDDQVSVTVPANSTLELEEAPTVFETADVQPGTIMTVMITVASDEEAVELPVVDGTIDQYGDIIPNDAEDQ
jgi:hypothetical protein